jgi:hypothetical protein
MTYQQQRYLSIAVAIALGMLGAVQLAAPETLGISPVAARWLGIVATGLGILQGFLPNVRGRSTDPEFLADRVWELTPAERQQLTAELEHRAILERLEGDDSLISTPPHWLPAEQEPRGGDLPVRRGEGR